MFPPPGFSNALLPQGVPRQSLWVGSSGSSPNAPRRLGSSHYSQGHAISWDPGASSEVPAFTGTFAKSIMIGIVKNDNGKPLMIVLSEIKQNTGGHVH